MPLPTLPTFHPRVRAGILEYPVHYMRGGTSTGLVLWERLVPKADALREELLRHLLGTPLSGNLVGNKQLTGLGRGVATSNKVFLVDSEDAPGGPRLVSTLAQLASEHARVDWSVNCGNMSAALPLWAFDTGLLTTPTTGDYELTIRNTNTGVLTTARLPRHADGRLVTTQIPGVPGTFPRVDLFLHQPVGAKTGHLLPTGATEDILEGCRVSCVDVAVPMVIVEAADLGKTAHESIRDLEADPIFMTQLRKVWVAAGLRMSLKGRNGQALTAVELAESETIPKVCIVGLPQAGGHLATRYFTPQTGHASLAVSGGCCLAAAALVPGTVAHRLAQGLPTISSAATEVEVAIENPVGLLRATIIAQQTSAGSLLIERAAYERNAQLLMRGYVPLYAPSPALAEAVQAQIAPAQAI